MEAEEHFRLNTTGNFRPLRQDLHNSAEFLGVAAAITVLWKELPYY